MAKTRGAKTPTPSAHSMTEAPQAPTMPPSEDGVPPSPPQASSSCPKKSVSRPPTKKARVSGPVESSEPPQPQPPTIESQIPYGMTPEPPIKGNLDCRARPFHSELCFDKETFRHQPELRDSFHLLQRASKDTIGRAATTTITVFTPEATSSTPPTTPGTPPVVPATSAPPPSESSITISSSEFRGLSIRAHQDQLIATQTQHTVVLRQIHQQLGILSPPEHGMPPPSEPIDPSQDTPPAEQTVSHEKTTIGEIETPILSIQISTVEPSSPHDPSTTT
ncbi:hypothetical protein AAG906_018940 [Vitis piasezkii]